MPIKGLTGTYEDHRFGSGMPKIGTLFKGSKKRPHPSKPGKFLNGLDLQYFRYEPEPEFAETAQLFSRLYGETPEVFERVYLAGSTTDEVFPAFMEEWNGTTLVRRCDRDDQLRWYDAQQARHLDTPKACEMLCGRKCGCKQIGRLKLVFPRLMEETGVFGYIAFSTHSVYDIVRIDSQLRDVEYLRGHLAGVPFIFGRAPDTFSAPNPQKQGERIKVTKSLCYIRPVAEFTRYELLGGLDRPALAAPGIGVAELPARTMSREEVESAKARLGAGDTRRIGEGGEIFDHEDDDDETPEWTADELWETLQGSFTGGIPHFENALNKYLNEGLISEQMSRNEVEAAIRLHRSAHGKYPEAVFATENRQVNFIERWVGTLPDDTSIVAALNVVSQTPLEHGLLDWRGDLYTAVAAVWARVGQYIYANIPFAEQTSEVVREIARLICKAEQQKLQAAFNSITAEPGS
jgi:hypothetical protein